jgi:UDP-glucose 4-epimerase
MKIVVTGGAGFIGSNVADAYVERGHEVFILDDFSTGRAENVGSGVTVHRVDIGDTGAAGLIDKIKPDVVSHHAAQMDVRRSVADPQFDAKVNILGFVNLLEACRNAGVKKVIFASSGGAVYGEQEVFPAAEEHPTRPASPYGVSKRAGELYLSYYQQAYGLPYVALRYANVYGPRQSTMGEAGVVAIFISQLLAGRTPVINGDGRQTRDYVFVGDVVAANVAALEKSFVGAVNIGTGRETDVVTLYGLLRDGVGRGLEAQHGPAKPGEQRRSCLDTALAAKVLNWRPATELKNGLEQTIAFYRQAS